MSSSLAMWAGQCSSPKIVSNLEGGLYTHLKVKPLLARHPLILSGYANPPGTATYRRHYIQTSHRQTGHGNCQGSILLGVLQQTFPACKTKQQIETDTRSDHLEHISECQNT